jgi:hypothetical protein
MTTLSQFPYGVEPQRQSIKVEEERTGIRDLTDPRYSADARVMRARADNMKITITMLEAERSRA